MQLNGNKGIGWPAFWDKPFKIADVGSTRELIRRVQARNVYMLNALAAARGQRGLHSARRLQRRYLLSFSAKLSAVCRAWRGSKIAECDDAGIMDMVELARTLWPMQKSGEQARARPIWKRDGESFRIIHSLTLRQRAADKLAADAARCLVDVLPTQFNQKGKGIQKLEGWLVDWMPSVQTVITVDIPSCFDVVNRSSVVANLLLPQRVIEAALFDVMDNAKRLKDVLTGIYTNNDIHAVGTSAKKRGIPQGSALAQLAADIEIDSVMRAIASVDASVHVAAHSDNIIILLEDDSWLGSVQSALTLAVTKQFGSNVTTALVHRIRYEKPASFNFCRRTYRWRKGKLEKHLPADYIEQFSIRAMIKLQDAASIGSSNGLSRCEASIRGFLVQHAEVKGALNECVDLLATLKEYRQILNKKSLQAAS